MSEIKYYYNTQTLRYEKVERSIGQLLWKIFGFIFSTMTFAIIIIVIAYSSFDSPKEKQLKREISQLTYQYKLIDQKLDVASQVLAGLEEKDDKIYRIIFEAPPIPSSIRKAGSGGTKQFKGLEDYDNAELMITTHKKLEIEKIRRQIYIQSTSYSDIEDMIQNKTKMLASLPAIQPISNKDLRRMASGYGYRIDPIYKTRKMHHGMDFTAPTGTEIYATGDGVVERAKWNRMGYGYHVIIDHGYGYRTLYAHMNKIIAKPGQKVKRGELIGLVGNTGKSTAPHLHYEVHKDRIKINPVYYYYNDLTPEEYDRMIELASRHSQSFD